MQSAISIEMWSDDELQKKDGDPAQSQLGTRSDTERNIVQVGARKTEDNSEGEPASESDLEEGAQVESTSKATNDLNGKPNEKKRRGRPPGKKKEILKASDRNKEQKLDKFLENSGERKGDEYEKDKELVFASRSKLDRSSDRKRNEQKSKVAKVDAGHDGEPKIREEAAKTTNINTDNETDLNKEESKNENELESLKIWIENMAVMFKDKMERKMDELIDGVSAYCLDTMKEAKKTIQLGKEQFEWQSKKFESLNEMLEWTGRERERRECDQLKEDKRVKEMQLEKEKALRYEEKTVLSNKIRELEKRLKRANEEIFELKGKKMNNGQCEDGNDNTEHKNSWLEKKRSQNRQNLEGVDSRNRERTPFMENKNKGYDKMNKERNRLNKDKVELKDNVEKQKKNKPRTEERREKNFKGAANGEYDREERRGGGYFMEQPKPLKIEEIIKEMDNRKKRSRNICIKTQDQQMNSKKNEILREIEGRLRINLRNNMIKFETESMIIVECESMGQKIYIMKNKKNLKGTKIYINDDLTQHERKVQKWIRNSAALEREQGAVTRVAYMKLIINGECWRWRDSKGQLEEEAEDCNDA